jgi:hypothetical protein
LIRRFNSPDPTASPFLVPFRSVINIVNPSHNLSQSRLCPHYWHGKK